MRSTWTFLARLRLRYVRASEGARRTVGTRSEGLGCVNERGQDFRAEMQA
jgi:hypothetical protein